MSVYVVQIRLFFLEVYDSQTVPTGYACFVFIHCTMGILYLAETAHKQLIFVYTIK